MRNHLAAAAFAAGLALPMFARPLHGQKALVYCPVGVDATGCDRIVSALQPKFAGGVDRGYDGSNGTLDLKTIDLDHYSVFVVPSLADDQAGAKPYAALRAAAARLHLAINGRVAVYSGAPDQGNLNRADKDAIIQSLATWAAEGHTRGTGLVGMVALLDLSANPTDRYSWVRSISLADVSADAELQSLGDSKVASYGLHVGGRAAARTEVGAIGGLMVGQGALVLYSNADRRSAGGGGASLDVSAGGAGPTLTTDKPDYLPGDTVLFSGTAWTPSDTVTITVHEDPQWSNPDRTVVAVVDGNGNLRSHDFVVQPRDFGVTFTATAVGNPSGLVAQVTFTDGTIAAVINTSVLNTSSTAGQCGTTTPATFLVNHEYCGQTTVQSITGTGATTLFMRWVRPGGGPGSIACSTSVPVVAGNTYGAKCTPDFPSTATADWTFQVSAQSTFNPALASVSVHVVSNTPPVANNDSYSTLEDAGLTIAAPGVLGNDTDAENNPLTVVLVSGPAHGTLALNANGSFTYTPAANYNGPDSFTYNANDGTANSNAAATVNITVNAVNDAPSFAKGADQTSFENAGAQTIAGWATAISAGPPDEAGQTLTFDVSNGNNALFSAQPSIDATGKLTFTSAPDAFGTATVTVQLHDDGGTANGGVDTSAPQTFTITITPINHAPTFTKGGNQVVLEDAGPQSVNGWATGISAGRPSESAQALDFVVTNDDNALFSSQPAVDATGRLTYTPAANANGSATVTLKLHDNGGTANGGIDTSPTQTFTIAVTPVNDAPTFNLIATATSAEDAGAQTVNGALTNASAGPNEGGQKLTLTVTNDKNSLFTVQPAIDPATGRLTYTSAPNANGTATVTVKLQDDGGTANGGVDQTTKTFVITVTPVDDAPVITTFYGPVQPIALGASISVTGAFSDVDLGDTPPDSHVGTIDWGDGTTSSLSITAGAGLSRSFSGSHTYAAPGVYTITAHIRDAGGLAGDATCKYPVVVFDSNGGFLTGGGWINTSTGKAAFGLVSKYNKGQATPGGDTEFQGPGFNFKSASCDWLVISGAKATYQGSGTINGAGNYGFMVTVIDGSLSAKHGSDYFRIRIWDKSNGAVIFDNQPGAADAADPTNATGGGSIRIHNN